MPHHCVVLMGPSQRGCDPSPSPSAGRGEIDNLGDRPGATSPQGVLAFPDTLPLGGQPIPSTLPTLPLQLDSGILGRGCRPELSEVLHQLLPSLPLEVLPVPYPHLFLLAPTPFTTNEVTPSPSPQLKQAGVLGAAVLRTGLAQTAGFRFVTIRERGRELILRAVNTTRNPGVGTLPCGQGTV